MPSERILDEISDKDKILYYDFENSYKYNICVTLIKNLWDISIRIDSSINLRFN